MATPTLPVDNRLPFPTRLVRAGRHLVEEFIIPDERKGEVLVQLYPFLPIPSLDDEMIDLHADKAFIVRDFRVTREYGMNYLVSPYYFESGGTVIDWISPVQDEEEVVWGPLDFTSWVDSAGPAHNSPDV